MAISGLPWSTSLAFIVTGASVVLAVVWAIADRRADQSKDQVKSKEKPD
jgi:hypothetical protein